MEIPWWIEYCPHIVYCKVLGIYLYLSIASCLHTTYFCIGCELIALNFWVLSSWKFGKTIKQIRRNPKPYVVLVMTCQRSNTIWNIELPSWQQIKPYIFGIILVNNMSIILTWTVASIPGNTKTICWHSYLISQMFNWQKPNIK